VWVLAVAATLGSLAIVLLLREVARPADTGEANVLVPRSQGANPPRPHPRASQEGMANGPGQSEELYGSQPDQTAGNGRPMEPRSDATVQEQFETSFARLGGSADSIHTETAVRSFLTDPSRPRSRILGVVCKVSACRAEFENLEREEGEQVIYDLTQTPPFNAHIRVFHPAGSSPALHTVLFFARAGFGFDKSGNTANTN
jgi:hypothetical protein